MAPLPLYVPLIACRGAVNGSAALEPACLHSHTALQTGHDDHRCTAHQYVPSRVRDHSLLAVAPTFAGSLFAWSVAAPRPFVAGPALTFLALTLAYVISLVLGLQLPARLNKQYVG